MKKKPIDIDNTKTKNVGIKAVLDQALQSYEKLPMLQIVFDRLIKLLPTSLRNFTSEAANIELTSFKSLRFNTVLDNISDFSIIAVVRAIEWENFCLLILDKDLAYSLIDVLLGGKSNVSSQTYISPKSYTYIEQTLIKQILEVILNDLSESFNPVSNINFSIDRIETNKSFAAIVRPEDAVIALDLSIKMDVRKGGARLVLPYVTIDPIKSKLQQIFVAEKSDKYDEWVVNLINLIMNINLNLDAVINNKIVTIGEVVNFKVGDVIILNQKKDEDVFIRCCGVPLLKGRIGKMNNNVAINVSKILSFNE